MTGIFTSKATGGKPHCARCGRAFNPRKEGDKFGPKCARKLAGQVELDSQNLVSGIVLTKGKRRTVPIYVKDENGDVTAVIL